MEVLRCTRLTPSEVAASAVIVATALTLWTTGNSSWIAAMSALLIPFYLAANRFGQRRRT